MSVVGRVAALWRYPVKSMAGERLERALFGPDGLNGDRGWALRDLDSGRLISAKRVPHLLMASAGMRPGAPVVALPDGKVCSVEDDSIDELLSAWLGRRVRIERYEPGERPVFLGEDGEFTGPGGRFFDGAPVLLVTMSTLRALAGLHPTGDFDPRRFRPNLVVECDEDGFSEQGWIGATLSVGEASFDVVRPCRRCVVTTAPQPGLPKDRRILETVAREADNIVGVYARVRAPGAVDAGDSVSVGA